jgi:hypothetical protein
VFRAARRTEYALDLSANRALDLTVRFVGGCEQHVVGRDAEWRQIYRDVMFIRTGQTDRGQFRHRRRGGLTHAVKTVLQAFLDQAGEGSQ